METIVKSSWMTSIFLAVLMTTCLGISPPVFNYSYYAPFEETINLNKSTYIVNGQLFYDGPGKRERMDYTNGRNNFICGSIMKGVNTSCISLITKGIRWILFPDKTSCCLCCTAEQGCGVLRPDWLKEGDYQGVAQLDGVSYDLWHKKGPFDDDYLYLTRDKSPKIRRIRENYDLWFDYDLEHYSKQTFADSVFAVPPYCNQAKPTLCPTTSACHFFRTNQKSSHV